MGLLRASTLSAAALALLVASCSARADGGPAETGAAAQPSLTSLAPVPPAPSTTRAPTTTSTVALPPAPDLDGGSICDLYDPAVRELGVVASELVREASGIAAGRRNPVLWAVNDSGNAPLVHAIGLDGTEVAAVELAGVFAFDWEAIAVGPGPDPGMSYIYVGDVGDNLRIRSTIEILRFPEPDLSDPVTAVDDVTRIRLEYPDSAHDSEAMWVDPLTGDVFVVTKQQNDGRAVVYRAAAEAHDGPQPIELVPIADFAFGDNVFVTAADVSPDGAVVALRGYDEVWMWLRRDLDYRQTFDTDPCMAPSPDEIQGEALAFVDGLAYVTLSEGSAKPLNQVSPAR